MRQVRRPVRLFSIVFGDRYLDWFDRACVHSLCWPKNLAALLSLEGWDLWTTKEDAPRALSIASRVGIKVEVHDGLKEASWEDKATLKRNLQQALLEEIRLCGDSRKGFLWVAPDSIFGDGSIRSILEIGAVPGICVALAPLRVKAEGFLEAMGPGPLSNAALVKLSFGHLHQGFVEAEATRRMNNSYESGVSWRRIGDGLYAVTHRKHSSYLMQPTDGDVRWFRKMDKFGAYDHSFPKLLVDDQRQRVVGSSDAAFVAELTLSASHIAPIMDANPAEPDRFNQNMSHHAANRNVVCIWREGE